MPTIAYDVIEWLEKHPHTHADKARLLDQVPATQWAAPHGHWGELAQHCCNRVEYVREPRFMNRLSINIMTPLPRCLYRSPDGRGLAWLKSGGDMESYGLCEQQHCERAKQSNAGNEPPQVGLD